jgi:cell division protein FtsL
MNVYVIAAVAVLVVALCLVAGYWLRCHQTVIERQQLRAQRQVLDSEWKALGTVQQLSHLVYFGQQQMSAAEHRARTGWPTS